MNIVGAEHGYRKSNFPNFLFSSKIYPLNEHLKEVSDIIRF